MKRYECKDKDTIRVGDIVVNASGTRYGRVVFLEAAPGYRKPFKGSVWANGWHRNIHDVDSTPYKQPTYLKRDRDGLRRVNCT